MVGEIADPSLVDGIEVTRSLRSDPERGLSSVEAAARLADVGPNRLDAAAEIPAWRKLVAELADPLIYLLLGAVVVSLAAWIYEGAEGAPIEAIVISLIVMGNAVLGFLQQRQAERAVAALRKMAAPTAQVVRDGKDARVPAGELVPGDVLVLGEGDVVAADGRLLRTASLTVAEAPLTGESEPVLKQTAPLPAPAAPGDRVDMVFSGTAVTRGHGRAVVTGTGMHTEMGRIATLLEHTQDGLTPLQRETALVGRSLAIGVVFIAVAVVATILLTADIEGVAAVVDVLLLGVSLAVAAVPEGLPAIQTVVLAMGVQRMARRQAIVKRLSSVEALGSTTVIASDKTGTLTRNEMTVQRVVTRSGEATIEGIGYAPVGAVTVRGQPLENGPLFDEVHIVLAGGSLASNAALREEHGRWTILGDPTDAAFLVAQRKLGTTLETEARFERRGEIPFSSERRLMSAFLADAARGGRIAVATKGAPDVLLARCTRERVGPDEVPLSEDRRRRIGEDTERLAADALRTLAVAYRRLETAEAPEADEAIERDLVFVGLVGIIDPARPEAAAAIAEAHGAGVRVLMITGDHARTAGRIATDLGIVPAGDVKVLTGAELDAMDDATLAERCREVSVYARVAPEHKLRIVGALHASGNIVAMTGDGVNDAPALKAADIGIAMGITGTEVSKEAANIILADDNFATIVAATREGRAIFANLRKCLRYLLSSNIGEVLTMFLGVLGASVLGLGATSDGFVAPLLATQILWINLLTDSAPALALGFDPPASDVMRRPPRKLGDRVINRHMWLGLVYVGLVMAALTLLTIDLELPGGLIEGTGSIEQARTAGFTVLVFAQLFNAFNSRSERESAFRDFFHNPRLFAALALSAGLQVLVVHVPLLNQAFGTVPLSPRDWLLCLAIASGVLWLDELKKLVVRMASPGAPAPG